MNNHPPPSTSTRHVFVHGLILQANIGCFEHEQGITQPVEIDFDLEVVEPDDPFSDELEDVVCYNKLTQNLKAIILEGHIKLAETLAERIVAMMLEHDMIIAAKVKVAKPEAIEEAQAAGVIIERRKD